MIVQEAFMLIEDLNRIQRKAKKIMDDQDDHLAALEIRHQGGEQFADITAKCRDARDAQRALVEMIDLKIYTIQIADISDH